MLPALLQQPMGDEVMTQAQAADTPKPQVSARGLGRRFGPRWALRALDLDLEPGALLGLAGPNGSGKSTLLRMLAGLLRPSEGKAQVLGLDPFRQRRALMAKGARFVFAPPALYESLSAREQTLALARLSDPRLQTKDVDKALERVGLAGRAGEAVRKYSFGMRQRLAVAQALVPLPKVLVLDEPTEGLDPLAVLELRAVLRDLAAEGVTILLASHLMVELESLVDELLVLDQGEVLFQGRPAQLLEGAARLVIEASDPVAAARLLEAAGYPAELREKQVLLDSGALDLERCRALLAGAGLVLGAFSIEKPSLEAALLGRLRARRGAHS